MLNNSYDDNMYKSFAIVLAVIFIVFLPTYSQAQTNTDLEITGTEFNPITGNPSAVTIKNIGASPYTGEVKTTVRLLGSGGAPLPANVGFRTYGFDYFLWSNIAGATPIATIEPGQTYRVALTEAIGHRHRLGVLAKAELLLTDANNNNNHKTVSLPLPDLISKINSIVLSPGSQNAYDDYTVKFSFNNVGAVGFVAGYSLEEPAYELVVNYVSGKTTRYANDLAYQIRSNIAPGASISSALTIKVNKQETVQSITLSLDTKNILTESNKGNNSVTQSWDKGSTVTSTPSPTPTIKPSATPSSIIATEISAITPDPVKTTVSTGSTKLLGITIQPCTALESVKDVKDNLVSALTFNTTKKVENKLKQAATRANTALTNTNPACVTQQLQSLKTTQETVSKLITKLETKNAEPLALLAIQASVSQAKQITYHAAITSPSSTVKTQIATSETSTIAQVSATAKLITNSDKLDAVVSQLLASNDSAKMAVINLELAKKLEPIKTITESVKQAKQGNVKVIKTVIDSRDEIKISELEEFMTNVIDITDQKADAKTKAVLLEDFVKSAEKDVNTNQQSTPTSNSELMNTPTPTAKTDNKLEDRLGENITPNPDANITPSNQNQASTDANPCPPKTIPDNTC